MIKSFKCNETEKIFNLRRSKKFPPEIQQIALRKLKMLNQAISIVDLRIPPSNRLEKLSGNLSNYWSIRINNQWRICFQWQEHEAVNVYITDYH